MTESDSICWFVTAQREILLYRHAWLTATRRNRFDAWHSAGCVRATAAQI